MCYPQVYYLMIVLFASHTICSTMSLRPSRGQKLHNEFTVYKSQAAMSLRPSRGQKPPAEGCCTSRRAMSLRPSRGQKRTLIFIFDFSFPMSLRPSRGQKRRNSVERHRKAVYVFTPLAGTETLLSVAIYSLNLTMSLRPSRGQKLIKPDANLDKLNNVFTPLAGTTKASIFRCLLFRFELINMGI